MLLNVFFHGSAEEAHVDQAGLLVIVHAELGEALRAVAEPVKAVGPFVQPVGNAPIPHDRSGDQLREEGDVSAEGDGFRKSKKPRRSSSRTKNKTPIEVNFGGGDGGIPEHSRRKASRKKRLAFLSRAEHKTGPPSKQASMGKRRKDAADMQFSRLLRKPRKRNAAAFFRRGAADRTRTGTDFTPADFKSALSTYSNTTAFLLFYHNRVSPSRVNPAPASVQKRRRTKKIGADEEIMLDKPGIIRYNRHAVQADHLGSGQYGGIAQLVEHPVHTRVVICSSQIAATRPVGQVVKTPPFHGGNMGSSPVRVTKKRGPLYERASFFGYDPWDSNSRNSDSPVGCRAAPSSPMPPLFPRSGNANESRTGHQKTFTHERGGFLLYT